MNDAVCRIERGPYGAQVILAVPEDSQEIPYQLETLITCRPKALLPAYRQICVTGARYAYPVTGLSALAELAAQKQLSRKQAGDLVRQIHDLILDLPDRLLSPEQLLLHPERLFIMQPSWKIQLVYQPFLPLHERYGEQDLLDWSARSAIRFPHMRRRWLKRQFPASAKDFSTPRWGCPPSQQVDDQADKTTTSQTSRLSFILAMVQLLVLIITLLTVWQPRGWPVTMGLINRPLIIFFVLTILLQGILLSCSKSNKNTREDPTDQTCGEYEQSNTGSMFSIMNARLKTLASFLNPILVWEKLRASITSRAEKSEANLGRVREMPTELLSSKQALFRLATLSEGMIGTAEETAGQRAFILTEEFVVGRDFRLVDLCLTGYAVGRRHARISRKGATFFITDLGSKNGTRLNGEPLNKLIEYRLPDRCQIEFADRCFYFEAEELLEPLPVTATGMM